jgi:hypothetical protein
MEEGVRSQGMQAAPIAGKGEDWTLMGAFRRNMTLIIAQ